LAQDILKLALDQSNEDVMKRDLSQALPASMGLEINDDPLLMEKGIDTATDHGVNDSMG